MTIPADDRPPMHEVVLQRAISTAAVSEQVPLAVFYHLPTFRRNAAALVDAFPPNALHAFALKAAPFPNLLRHANAAGLGGECASISELAVCHAAAIPPNRVIYDSPAKTHAHLRHALAAGVHINADNLHELDRIANIIHTASSTSTVGLRVNPQIGNSRIADTFTAASACKFGEPLRECRSDIIHAFKRYTFLTAILVHVGSQGCDTELLVEGAREAVDLADEIVTAGGAVDAIDIGGGLTVDYWGDTEVTFAELVAQLRKRCPRLFEFRVMTEFGRRVAAKTAFIVTRVEWVKESGGETFVICHAGSDVLMRPVYHATKWGHRIEVFDAKGQRKQGSRKNVHVGGPLCFAGDIIARDRELVLPDVGDWLVIRDAGAYTLSMYCRHTSQLTPPVYGVEEDGEMETIKRQETVEDVVRFWS